LPAPLDSAPLPQVETTLYCMTKLTRGSTFGVALRESPIR